MTENALDKLNRIQKEIQQKHQQDRVESQAAANEIIFQAKLFQNQLRA